MPTDLESDIFTEFFLTPLSDLLIYVLQFAIETRGLNIIGGRNGYNPISEALQTPQMPEIAILKLMKAFKNVFCHKCMQTC